MSQETLTLRQAIAECQEEFRDPWDRDPDEDFDPDAEDPTEGAGQPLLSLEKSGEKEKENG